MKVDAEFVKKYLFWILLAVAVPLVLLAMVLLATAVSASIAAERAKVESLVKKLKDFKDVKNENWLSVGKDKAKDYKDLEEETWIEAWNKQNELYTWAKRFEDKYHYRDGLFAKNIQVTRTKKKEGDGAPSPPGGEAGKDEKPGDSPPDAKKDEEVAKPAAEKVIDSVTGVVRNIEAEWLDLEVPAKGKDKKLLRIYKTEGVRVSVSEDGTAVPSTDFSSISLGDKATITFQRGKYFGDDMTFEEFDWYRRTYRDQIDPILKMVQPLRKDGTGVVQFRGWLYDPKDLPAADSPFFRYVASWDVRDPKLNAKEAWTAQEDLWIQKELFRMIRQANDYVADFRGEGGIGNDVFYFSHDDWKLDLQVTVDNKIQVGLTNRAAFPRRPGEKTFAIQVSDDGKNKATLVQFTHAAAVEPGARITPKGSPFALSPGVTPKGIFQVHEIQKPLRRTAKTEGGQPAAGEGEKKDPEPEKKEPEPKGDAKKKPESLKYIPYRGEGGGKNNTYYFTNPYWKLTLRLTPDNKLNLHITNLTSVPARVDTDFQVRISDDPEVNEAQQYVTLRVHHPPLGPGAGAAPKGSPYKLNIDDDTPITGILAVRQVLTWETAAIKRIDRMAIGGDIGGQGGAKDDTAPPGGGPVMPPGSTGSGGQSYPGAPGASAAGSGNSHSHRTFPKGLTALFKEDVKTTAPAPAAGQSEDKYRSAPGGGTAKASGASPNGVTFTRYVELTRQARRVPVALVLIVDQEHVGRVLASLTNSKMRFLTTQVLINRYPHSIRPPIEGSKVKPGDFSGSYPDYSGGYYPNKPGSGPVFPPGGGSGPVFPPGGSGGGAVMPPGGGFMPPPTSAPVAGDDRQTNVELVIYGYMTIYQRYPERPADSGGGSPSPAPAS